MNMKFGNILKELILEGPIGKDTLNFLFNKWKQEKNDITPENIMDIYAEFEQKKNGISAENPTPIIKSFLRRFTSENTKDKFENPTTENLKNIKSYTYKQIVSLLTDYPNSKLVVDDDEKIATILDDKDKKPTTEKIEASKGLWSDPGSAYINEGTLRVYKITTMKQSMDFGYFVQYINKIFNGSKSPFWCVTRRGGEAGGGNNLWAHYRNSNTFYFVIDDKRWKENLDDKYYISALQKVNTTPPNDYVLSPLSNNDDGRKNWSDIIEVYPELANHKSKFVSVPYNSVLETNEETSFVSRMSEEPGPYEFASAERRHKEQFIDTGVSLKKIISWEHMDDELKKRYINTTNRDNFTDKFSSYELFKYIKKNDNKSFKALVSRLNYVLGGAGLAQLSEYHINKSFYLRRRSVDNQNVVILEERGTKLTGIFDYSKDDWVTHDGIYYDSGFKIAPVHDAYIDEEGNAHFVEIHKRDNVTFYVVYDGNTDTGDGHFMSKKKFDELKLYDPETSMGRKPEPETDVDIKENYQ